MGGGIITQAAEYRPDKIKTLMYLTALLPANGESMGKVLRRNTATVLANNFITNTDQTASMVREEVLVEGFYGDCSAEDVALAKLLLTPQSTAPLRAKLQTSAERFGRIPRVAIECLRDRAPVNAVVRRTEGHEDRYAPTQPDRGNVRVVRRLKQEHFVAGVDQRGQRAEQRFGRTRGDQDFPRRIVPAAVEPLDLHGEGLAERGKAGHRRVLVESLAHIPRDRFDQRGRRAKVWKALREIDRLALTRQPAHDFEDADGARRKLRLQDPHELILSGGAEAPPDGVALLHGATPRPATAWA